MTAAGRSVKLGNVAVMRVSRLAGTLLTIAAATGQVLRRLPTDLEGPASPAAFAPHLTALAAPALVLPGRHRPAAAVVAAAGIAAYGPLFRRSGGSSARSAPGLTVLSANCLVGSADADHLVSLVREHDVDVLMLVELTAQLRDRVRDAGLDSVLPYSETRPATQARGVGVWSRRPLADRVVPDGLDLVSAVLPDGLRVAAVHVPAPWPWDSGWAPHLRRLADWLAGLGPVLVAGDYNATVDHWAFRRLLTGGVADAAGQAGAGYPVSYPDDGRPSMIAIDHVLARGPVARSARTLHVRGTDHRALLVGF